jgi:hypothetical protein
MDIYGTSRGLVCYIGMLLISGRLLSLRCGSSSTSGHFNGSRCRRVTLSWSRDTWATGIFGQKTRSHETLTENRSPFRWTWNGQVEKSRTPTYPTLSLCVFALFEWGRFLIVFSSPGCSSFSAQPKHPPLSATSEGKNKKIYGSVYSEKKSDSAILK